MVERQTVNPGGLGLPPEVVELVRAALWVSDPGPCPSLDQLASFADGALASEVHRRIGLHLQACSGCAALAADLCRLFAPVRKLHAGWLGWRGPLQEGWGWWPAGSDLQPAWQQHRERCSRCRARADRLRWLASGARRDVAAFAFGMAAMLLLLLPFRAVGPVNPPVEPMETVPKSGGADGGASTAWLNAQEVLQRLLEPTEEQRPYVIAYWEEASRRKPEDRAILEKLKQLYWQQAAGEADSARRAEWEAKARAADERLARLGRGGRVR